MIEHEIGDYDGVYADSRGKAGGLALLWYKTIKLNLLPLSSNHIDVEVEGLEVVAKRRFTSVYGWSETTLKLKKLVGY